jgi:hypothetical protein
MVRKIVMERAGWTEMARGVEKMVTIRQRKTYFVLNS